MRDESNDRTAEQGRDAAAAGGESAAISALVDQAERMVRDSGYTGPFAAALWMERYLDEPRASLGGVTPRSLLGTAEGRALVASQLQSLDGSAYW